MRWSCVAIQDAWRHIWYKCTYATKITSKYDPNLSPRHTGSHFYLSLVLSMHIRITQDTCECQLWTGSLYYLQRYKRILNIKFQTSPPACIIDTSKRKTRQIAAELYCRCSGRIMAAGEVSLHTITVYCCLTPQVLSSVCNISYVSSLQTILIFLLCSIDYVYPDLI